MENKSVENKIENRGASKKFIIFFIVLMVPVAAILVSVFLTNKDININQLIIGGFKGQEVLGDSEEAEPAPGDIFSAFAEAVKPVFTKPEKVMIDKIALNSGLVSVGIDDSGVMETPENWSELGWLRFSGKPGEKSNMIINGHYDDSSGSPAVFYKLKNIEIDDEVEIEDNYGRIFTYKVVESTYVDIEDPERLDVLKDQEGKSTLTLITCGGVWTPDAGYNKRLVVSAELVDQ